MANIPFFTPISFEKGPRSFQDHCLEIVDHYFYLGGKKASVVGAIKRLRSLLEKQIVGSTGF